jgi:hypothetical protein
MQVSRFNDKQPLIHQQNLITAAGNQQACDSSHSQATDMNHQGQGNMQQMNWVVANSSFRTTGTGCRYGQIDNQVPAMTTDNQVP